MKDLIIEQKSILILSCYRAKKYRGTPQELCPWAYEEVNEKCGNCRWLNVEKAHANGRPAVIQSPISHVDPMLDQIDLKMPVEYLTNDSIKFIEER